MIFDYFFLKFYNYYANSKVREFSRFYASITFGLFINFNVIEISMILAKLDILPFIYPLDDKKISGVSTLILATILFLLYNKKRIESTKSKFSEDKYKSCKKNLNLAFSLYIVLTILAFFIMIFWKPNYLPTW